MRSIYVLVMIFALGAVASAQLDHDVGVSAIISPPESTDIYRYHPIIIEVTNFGLSLESFDITFDAYIADSVDIAFTDTINVSNFTPEHTDTLTGNRTFSIIFSWIPDWILFYDYDIYAYTTLDLDENASNDTTYLPMRFINGFLMIAGDRYGNPVDVNIGSVAEIPLWGATPQDNYIDSVGFMHIPIATNDSVISLRYPSIEYDPQDTLPFYSYFTDSSIISWNERYFYNPRTDHHRPGWTNQGVLGFYYLAGPPGDPFLTYGDTVLIGNFVMKTVFDTSLFGDTLSALQSGYDDANGHLMWGCSDAITPIYPDSVYGPIRFMTPDELGYITGTVTDPGGAPLDSVYVSLTDAFREDTTDLSGEYYLPWITPGIYSMEFYHPDYGSAFVNDVEILAGDTTVVDSQLGAGCEYLPGDANGNDNTNGLDVVYLVAYLKGGPPPPDECNCPPHGLIYPAADANGSCAANGLDVTYMVSHFKGGPPILYCADCPPLE